MSRFRSIADSVLDRVPESGAGAPYSVKADFVRIGPSGKYRDVKGLFASMLHRGEAYGTENGMTHPDGSFSFDVTWRSRDREDGTEFVFMTKLRFDSMGEATDEGWVI